MADPATTWIIARLKIGCHSDWMSSGRRCADLCRFIDSRRHCHLLGPVVLISPPGQATLARLSAASATSAFSGRRAGSFSRSRGGFGDAFAGLGLTARAVALTIIELLGDTAVTTSASESKPELLGQ